jgi:hypothetical protein
MMIIIMFSIISHVVNKVNVIFIGRQRNKTSESGRININNTFVVIEERLKIINRTILMKNWVKSFQLMMFGVLGQLFYLVYEFLVCHHRIMLLSLFDLILNMCFKFKFKITKYKFFVSDHKKWFIVFWDSIVVVCHLSMTQYKLYSTLVCFQWFLTQMVLTLGRLVTLRNKGSKPTTPFL